MEQFSQKPTENWQKIFYTTKAAGKSPRNQEQQQRWHHDGSSTPPGGLCEGGNMHRSRPWDGGGPHLSDVWWGR